MIRFHDLLAQAVPLAARDAEVAGRQRDLAARQSQLSVELDGAKRALREISEAFAAGGVDAPSRDEVLAANSKVQEIEALSTGFEIAARRLTTESDQLRPERNNLQVGLVVAATEMMRERARLRASEDSAWFAAEIITPIDGLDLRGPHGGSLGEAVKLYLPDLGKAPQFSIPADQLLLDVPGGGRARIDTQSGREQLERIGLEAGIGGTP